VNQADVNQPLGVTTAANRTQYDARTTQNVKTTPSLFRRSMLSLGAAVWVQTANSVDGIIFRSLA
jgi:hypothetical protein